MDFASSHLLFFPLCSTLLCAALYCVLYSTLPFPFPPFICPTLLCFVLPCCSVFFSLFPALLRSPRFSPAELCCLFCFCFLLSCPALIGSTTSALLFVAPFRPLCPAYLKLMLSKYGSPVPPSQLQSARLLSVLTSPPYILSDLVSSSRLSSGQSSVGVGCGGHRSAPVPLGGRSPVFGPASVARLIIAAGRQSENRRRGFCGLGLSGAGSIAGAIGR